MSRKFKKGYFVRGEFVAEGSERDLELKRELKGTAEQSRTELKHASDALQQLGTDLLELRADLRAQLGLPEQLLEALDQARRITDFEGKRRQMQFIGKLMRKLDSTAVLAARTALQEQSRGSAQETRLLHEAQTWRTRLISEDTALAAWMAHYPDTDAQQLRALVRQARKDAKPEKPGAAPRHGRAYRELYQLVHAALDALPAPDAAATAQSPTLSITREAS